MGVGGGGEERHCFCGSPVLASFFSLFGGGGGGGGRRDCIRHTQV